MSRLVLTILPFCLGTLGCTVVLDPGEAQCETDKDCEARGFAGATCTANVCEKKPAPVDDVWGCLGHVVEPVADKTKKVELSVHLALIGGGSVTMATIDVCDKLDPACSGMDPDLPKGLSPDAEGTVTFSVVQGFDGFVRVSGPELMPSRVYVGRPIVTPPDVKEVQLLKEFDYSTLIAFAGLDLDMTRGTTVMLAVDCSGKAVGGVRFQTTNIDGQSQEYYLVNQAPTTPPTATETDIDGFGGFFNMPAAAAVAKSIRASDGAYVGESSFQVLPYTISYVQIAPTPK